MTYNAAGGETVTHQAAAFLTAAVQNEVDGAQVGPVQVLVTNDGTRVYAAAVVAGPLRAYLATAWGAAGAVSHSEIVSYHDPQAAQAALVGALSREQDRGYIRVTPDG